MATINSTQSGLWSSSSTWGGATPAAGDTININNGHTVTYDKNDNTLYGRININAGGALVHQTGIHTRLCCSMFIYVYGRYEMVPDSETLFSGTSKSGGTEGQVVGIYARGDQNGCQLILNGSLPMPETTLTSNVYINDHILPVADASKFAVGEYISVYRDCSSDTNNRWLGRDQSDEGFIIHYISGNNIYIRKRVGREDTLAQSMNSGINYAYVNKIKQWETGLKIFIDNEAFTITAIDEANNKLTFSSSSTTSHSSGALIYETGCIKEYRYDIMTANYSANSSYVNCINADQWAAGDSIKIGTETYTISSVDVPNSRLYITGNTRKYHCIYDKIFDNSLLSHKSGDKVYKLATVTTAQSNSGTNTITVASTSMLNVGDRLAIEGNNYDLTATTEALITNINGNVITLNKNLNANVLAGYIVTKTNRDCKISVIDNTLDASRVMIFYEYGGSGVTNRKLIIRYCEISHIANSYSSAYRGLVVRGDLNRTDTPREIKGNVVRDGWDTDRCGIWGYSSHYIHFRNNVLVGVQSLSIYDSYGSSYYNNIVMSSYQAGIRHEQQYYYNQTQFNLFLNIRYYAIRIYSAYTSFHKTIAYNFTRNSGRSFEIASNNAINGSIYNNRFDNIQYRHVYSREFAPLTILYNVDFQLSRNPGISSGNLSTGLGSPEYQNTYSYTILMNKDFIKGNFEIHNAGGWFEKDTSIHLGNGWSFKGCPNASNYYLKLYQAIPVEQGKTYIITGYFRKNSSYNGGILPCIYIKELFNNNIIIQEMTNVNDQWVKVELSYTSPYNDMIEISFGGRATAGNFWIDPRASITTNSSDINTINKINNMLKFNLDPIYNNSGILLGDGVSL